LNFASRQFVRTGALLVVGLIFLLCAGAARFAWDYELATAWVTHTTQVMAEIRNAQVLLAKASLSSGPALQTGLTAASDQARHIGSITRDNPEQQKSIADFRAALSGAQSGPAGPINPASFAAANLALERMSLEEYHLLSDRLDRQTKATRNGAFTACGLCFALLVLGIATAAAARIAFRHRDAAESALVHEKHELTRYSRDLTVISTGSSLIQAAQAESEIYSAVAHTLRDMFPDSRGCLGIISPNHDFVEICSHWGDPDDWVPFAPSECLALSSGNTVHRTRWPLQVCPAHPPSGSGDQICLPLRTATGMPGLLQIETGCALSDKRADVLAIFASHVGLGLANLKMREALRRDSIRDPLTGLFNRRYFDETLRHELARALRHNMPLSLLILDLDHFKALNDTHGHVAGDDALRAFARILRTTFRAGDVICRYGGEEFALLLPAADLENAWSKAETFRSAVEQAMVSSNGRTLGSLTVSVGVATSADFQDPEELIRAADAALYQAKRMGRNAAWVCTPRAVPFPAVGFPASQGLKRGSPEEVPPSPSILLPSNR